MAHFATPADTLFGEGALEEALPYFQSFGKKALIVTGKHVGKSPMMERLKEVLEKGGIGYSVYDGITGEPTVPMVMDGVRLYKEEGCDFLIGIGGGSPLDSAKAIAAMAVQEVPLAELNGKEITGQIPPVAAIPTTAGTGSEATKFTVITGPGTDIKMLLKGDILVPKLAVVDPAFTVDMPKSVTACTGLDALTHAVEAYTSKKALPFTDPYAVSAVSRILTYLPRAYKDGRDYEAREQMEVAAYMAGVCINNSSVTIVHGMSRPIGALFHVAHGRSNAMLIDKCLRFVLDGAYERFGSLARLTGVAAKRDSDEAASEKLMDAIAELVKVCEIPTLREYGIEEEAFSIAIPKMAKDAIASGSPGNCWKTVTAEDCEKLYQEIYDL